MAGPNPKIASLSVTVIAVAAIQAGALFLAISEQTANDGPRLDRFLGSFIVVGLLWSAIALIDLFAFPTMRMTRLVAGPAFMNASVALAAMTIFQIVLVLLGSSVDDVAGTIANFGFSFVVLWALTSLWGLGRERLRASRHRETGSVVDAHQTTADVVDTTR